MGILWPTPIGGSCDWGMLRLTLFPLNPDSAERRQIGIPYKTLAELDTIRPWHDAEFAGRAVDDFIAFERVIQFVKAIQADTSHEGGVRIRFKRHATFGSLVAALDIMDTLNLHRYWLDIKHEPLTLYVITNEPEHDSVQPIIL